MNKIEKIEAKDIIALLDKDYELIFMDYDSNLDENLDKVQDSIQNQNWEALDGLYEDWDLWEAKNTQIDWIMKNSLKDDVKNEFEIEDDEAEELIEKFQEEIQYAIEDRDGSDFLKDLIRHTSDPVCWYPTGYEVEEQTWNLNEKEFAQYVKEIKRVLKIKLSETKFDKKISELLANATYGGRLVVFFSGDIDNLLSIEKNGFKRIRFDGAEIALIDNFNGSGHNVYINHKFSLPLNPEEIRLDKCTHYSYTYEVCGMSSNWCNATNYNLTRK
jgi:hypothetical protein